MDEPLLQIVREVSSATTLIAAQSRRLDDMAGAIRDIAAEKSSAHEKLHARHDDLEHRVEVLERFQARLFGLAAGVGIGSGLGSAWLLNALGG